MMEDFFTIAKDLGFNPEWTKKEGKETRDGIALRVGSAKLRLARAGTIGLLTFSYAPRAEDLQRIQELPPDQQVKHGFLLNKEMLDDSFIGERVIQQTPKGEQPLVVVGRYVSVEPGDSESVRRFAETRLLATVSGFQHEAGPPEAAR